MNYLAHLYLADGTPDSLLGNLMADFLRGDTPDRFSPAVQAGIRLHRLVDAYTDTHPVVLECKRIVQPPFRRFAGIITDVAWDYFLARDWHQHAPEELGEFTGRVYALLEERHEALPERLQRLAPRMIAGDWLRSYGTLDGACAVFPRAARLLKRENCLAEAGPVFRHHCDEWEDAFRRFFPDLVSYVRTASARLSMMDDPAASAAGCG